MKVRISKPVQLIKVAALAGLLSICCNLDGIAQGGPGSGGPQPAAGVPIDGGASLLLAAGAAYGLKKINDMRKQNNNPDPEA